MNKTLFTPQMIETYMSCRRAYKLAFEPEATSTARPKTGAVVKRFILKALSEINRGHITNVNQVQKFLGHHWPGDALVANEAVKAFLFVYKGLTAYVDKPYAPAGSRTAAVALKIRARVPGSQVYLEDTFDSILWYPKEKRLEFVDYHLHNLKSFDPAWPAPTILVKQFLAEKLRSRWPFEKLALTFCRVSPQGTTQQTVQLDPILYRAHWPQILEVLEEMKAPPDYAPHREEHCSRCRVLKDCQMMDVNSKHHLQLIRSA